MSLLSEACELEHGLACSYLYAAFSLKQEVSEGGLDWRQLQLVRRWASEIYMVAAEEMLHLAQAWNILAAVGGSPYYLRPNFPQRRTYYGFGLPLALEPFGIPALERFVQYETPVDYLPPRVGTVASGLDDAPASFRSVGELYGLIGEQIAGLPESKLFFPGSQGEMGSEIAHFPDLIPVRNSSDARAAIQLITEQGEGISTNREDSHFAVFVRMKEALEEASQSDPQFVPARPALENPVSRIREDWASGGPVNLITNPLAQQTADLFDDVYTLMLRLLQHAFSNGPAGLYSAMFANVAIDAMTTVLKPIGEALALSPSGVNKKNAGACFGLTRHVPLASPPNIARTVAAERAAQLAEVGAMIAGLERAPQRIAIAADRLARLAIILNHP